VVSDLQGIALVIAATGGAVAAVVSALGATWSKKSQDASEKALAKIENVRVEFNGHMEKFMAVKDELTETRVQGSYKQGQFDQRAHDENSTSTG
jgi:hypothetical protein